MKPGKEACLRMAEYHHNCRHEKLMWQWLFTWTAWSDDADFFSEPAVKVVKKKPRKRWKHLSIADTKDIIKQMPNWSTDHLNTFIFKVLVEEKFKEINMK